MSALDRRALFTSGAAAALLAATGVSLEAAPRRGGRLRLAVPRADERFTMAVHGAVYDTLTEVGPDGLLKGELVTNWFSAKSGQEWTLELRTDARFHDGRIFEAQDAALSLKTHGFDAQIDAVETHTLRLWLDHPDPQLPYHLADPRLVMFANGSQQEKPMGTGLYEVQRFRDGRHFLGRRVRPHFKDGTSGWFDEVEIAVIPDPDVRAEALRDGFVDVADLPIAASLQDASAFVLRPDADSVELAARVGVGVPDQLGTRAPLDDGRIAQRWWMT